MNSSSSLAVIMSMMMMMLVAIPSNAEGIWPSYKMFFEPSVTDKGLQNFYKDCDGKNWPKQFSFRWDAEDICAWDNNEKLHPSPWGTRCISNNIFHKSPPVGDGGLLFLDHASGHAKGKVPREFQAFQGTNYIGLGGNQLEGPIWNTSFHTSLFRLDLSRNQFSGELGDDFMQRNVEHSEIINLGYNNFEGKLPERIKDLIPLSALLVNNNKFSGNVPDLSTCTFLRHLNLADNQFTGNLNWVKALSGLAWLQIGNNKFSGTLPELPASISHFSASGNDFSGKIPESYGNLGYLHTFICVGCKIECPSPNFLEHVFYSTHCKTRPNPPGHMVY